MIYRLCLKAEAEPRVPCVPRREPGNENGARVAKMVTATRIGEIVWFPGSRLGTSMIYRLCLKAEAEPRVPCVPRREPGNENGARVGKKVAATTIGEISWTTPSLPIYTTSGSLHWNAVATECVVSGTWRCPARMLGKREDLFSLNLYLVAVTCSVLE